MFYIYNWTSLKKWVVILALFVLFALSYRFSSVYIFENATQVGSVEGGITKSITDDQEVALTFNVPWGDDVIVDVLEVLDDKGVKATFFVNGEWALRNESLAEFIIEENHEVGLFGYSQEAYKDQSFDYIKEDIEKGETVLKNLGYEPLVFVRVPENLFSESITEYIYTLGYRTVFWSIFANIDQSKDAAEIGLELSEKAEPGDIIVMPINDSLTKGPEAIETFIDDMDSKGFQFVSLTELLSPAQMEIEPIE